MSCNRRLMLFLVTVLLGGCTTLQSFSLRPYRMNIQQGNYLEAESVSQLEIGMTRSQVRFLVGTPMVADPFNSHRWDYVFYFKIGRSRDEVQNRLTVWFEGDRVVRIDRPELPATEDQRRIDFDA